MTTQAAPGEHDRWIITGFIAALLLAWGLFAFLPLIALRSAYFTLKTEKDVERVRSTLGQLGTYGDMFGALNSLFSGAALIGVVYAVILQRRELHHQQEEIERNERNRVEAEKAREIEAKKMAVSEHTTAMLNAACFLAQTYATKLASFPPEVLSHADRTQLEERRAQRAETALDLEKHIALLNVMFDRALQLAKAAIPEEEDDREMGPITKSGFSRNLDDRCRGLADRTP